MFISSDQVPPKAKGAYTEKAITGSVLVLKDQVDLNYATFVKITFRDGPVRYQVDGNNPTSTVGLMAYDGDYEEFWVNDARNLRMIRTGSTNGKAQIQRYEWGS